VQIEGFRNGDFGIDLLEENIISVSQSTAFSENFSSDIQWGTEFADFYLWGTSNNYSPWGQVYYGRVFLGFAGNDFVTSADNVPQDDDPSPSFYGGEGDDVLYTNSFYGHIVGGSGQDIIVGGKGNDYLYGDIDFELFNFFVHSSGEVDFYYRFGRNGIGNEPIFTYADKVGQYRDGDSGNAYGDEIYFEGGVEEVLRWFGFFSPLGEPDANNDYIYGGDGNDVIFGGSGHDILYGGDGDDELYGGGGYRSGTISIQNASLSFNFSYFLKQAAYGFSYEAGNDFLDGGAGNDILMDADGGSDYMLGGEGDDWLEDASYDVVAGGSINYLDGGVGNDVIFTRNPFSEGFDVLVGGEGNDFLVVASGRADLIGGAGNDIYRVSSNSGSAMEVTINNYDKGGFDTLVLPTSYLLSDQKLLLTRDEKNLYFRHPEYLYSVTILNWFADANFKIDRILFDNVINPWDSQNSTELSLDIEAIESMFRTGSSGSNFLWGTRGNDHLQAFAGDDYLNGDAGDDVLEGGEGNDTFVFSSKSGWDTVSDASGDGDSFVIHGVTPNNVQVNREGNFLQLFLGSLERGINIQWQPEIGYAIESIRFDDGTIWDTIDLENKALVGNVLFPAEDELLTTDENGESAQADTGFDDSFPAGIVLNLGSVNLSAFFNPGNHASDPTEIDNVDTAGPPYPTNTTFANINNDWDANVATVMLREDKDQKFINKSLIVSSDSEGINELIENWFFPKSLLAPVGSGRIQYADLDFGHAQAKSSPREIASVWRRTHQQLDFLGYNKSSLELGEPDLHLGFGGGYATDTRFGLQGLELAGISGHGMPVFSRPFEGLREGLVPIV
jgi:Ca2+-binding RTX toxin-like protein